MNSAETAIANSAETASSEDVIPPYGGIQILILSVFAPLRLHSNPPLSPFVKGGLRGIFYSPLWRRSAMATKAPLKGVRGLLPYTIYPMTYGLNVILTFP
ncbi:MAG: hypothetical protein AAB038_04190, partial [Planctomycetota bacterium]